MNRSYLRRAGVAVAGAALLAGGAAQASAAPAKSSASGGVTIKIKMKGTGDEAMPYFTKARTVHRGERLTIVNKTSPDEIGPHSFTLIKSRLWPDTEAKQRKCGGGETSPPSGLCMKVAKAHKVDFESGAVGKDDIDVGRKGWDRPFGKKGDSWVAEAKGATTTRKVTAKAGTTLTFFCAVHPNMVGHIKVVD